MYAVSLNVDYVFFTEQYSREPQSSACLMYRGPCFHDVVHFIYFFLLTVCMHLNCLPEDIFNIRFGREIKKNEVLTPSIGLSRKKSAKAP